MPDDITQQLQVSDTDDQALEVVVMVASGRTAAASIAWAWRASALRIAAACSSCTAALTAHTKRSESDLETSDSNKSSRRGSQLSAGLGSPNPRRLRRHRPHLLNSPLLLRQRIALSPLRLCHRLSVLCLGCLRGRAMVLGGFAELRLEGGDLGLRSAELRLQTTNRLRLYVHRHTT